MKGEAQKKREEKPSEKEKNVLRTKSPGEGVRGPSTRVGQTGACFRKLWENNFVFLNLSFPIRQMDTNAGPVAEGQNQNTRGAVQRIPA